MRLSNLKIGTSVIVVGFHEACSDVLIQRFSAFGILNGSMIEICKIGLFKSIVKIRINDTLIALRRSEADHILFKIL